LVLAAVVAFVATATTAGTDNTLARFEGGIGVDGISNATGTVNIVRGVQPAGQLWRIADFEADVKADGHITAKGEGLVFAGGNTVGTALAITATGEIVTLRVFATVICETSGMFVERNTAPVPLAANGDFTIDDVLSPRPPPSCATPVLLIRFAGNRAWFSAGIQKFPGGER
jgi:hypothetical protein